MEETEVPGLVSDQQTYFCGNVAGKNVVQVWMLTHMCLYRPQILKRGCTCFLMVPLEWFGEMSSKYRLRNFID